MKRFICFSTAIVLLTCFSLGCSQMSAPAAKKLSDDEIVAWVNNDPIPKKQIDDVIAQMPPYMQPQFKNPQGLRDLVEKMVNVELVYQKAKVEGFVNREDIKEKIFQVTKQVVYGEYMQKAMEDTAKPDDAAMRKFYDENPQLFTKKTGDDKSETMKFEEIKDQISQYLARQSQQKVYDEVVAKLKTGASVKYNDKLLGPVEPPQPAMPGMGQGAPAPVPPAGQQGQAPKAGAAPAPSGK